jgi:glycine/D-amino acid oxidase-like deaminating enzyme
MTPTGLPTTAALDEQLFVNAGYNGRGALMATLSGKVLAGRLAPQVNADDHADDYVRYARDLLELRADEISVPWS